MKRILIIYTLILMVEAKNEVSVMKVLSDHIGELILQCQTELEFKDDVIQDLLDFWNDKNNLTSEDLGCALVCVFQRNEFLSEDGSTVMKDKTLAFYKAAGADDVLSGRLVELLILCKKQTRSIRNFCNSALEMAKCYRYGVFTMHWNPERFYWKHSQVPSSKRASDICDGTFCEDFRDTEVYNKLFRSC